MFARTSSRLTRYNKKTSYHKNEVANMSVSKSVLFLLWRSATANPYVAAFLRIQYKHVLHVYTQTIIFTIAVNDI